MKMLFVYLLFFTASLTAFSQTGDSRTVINDNNAVARTVPSFHSVSVSHGITLMMKQGDKEAVAVSASEVEYRDRIKTEVRNGVLNVYYDNDGSWKNQGRNKKLKAYVSVKTLENLTGSSGSTIIIDGSIKANNLDIDLSSGSTMKGDVQADELRVDQSSGAVSTISGKAQTVTIETSSGSNFSGYKLAAEVCSAHASSGGNIEISVSKEIDGKASSGGGIRYKGDAVLKNKSTSSGGSVSKNG